MFANERRNKILELLSRRSSVTVTELTGLFQVSLETIRRDLEPSYIGFPSMSPISMKETGSLWIQVQPPASWPICCAIPFRSSPS